MHLTVNQATSVYGGSNPSSSTTINESAKSLLENLVNFVLRESKVLGERSFYYNLHI